MNLPRAIGIGWLLIAANAVWISSDSPKGGGSDVVYLVAAAAAFVVALSSAFFKTDWSGVVLLLASIVLALVGLMVLVGSVSCGHGCSNIRPSRNAAALLSFFLVPPLAIAGFIVGLKRAKPAFRHDPSDR
jgi:hypothetical protein